MIKVAILLNTRKLVFLEFLFLVFTIIFLFPTFGLKEPYSLGNISKNQLKDKELADWLQN